jgi:hypothetical protein
MRKLEIKYLPDKSKAWIDRDIIMLFSCFQILEDYIIKENGLTHCDQEYHKDWIEEINTLYNWWNIRKENLYNKNDDEDDLMLERLIKIRRTLWT